MSSQGGATPPLNFTMVVVDKDKGSVHAFRWVIKHIDSPLIIAHVKNKKNPHHSLGGTNVFPPDEEDVANVFNPLRQLCQSNATKMTEVVIDDSDVVRGIVEYAQRNRIHTIVVGAPYTKRTFAKSLSLRVGSKKFKGQDMTTAIMKSAPDFSNVYVISKGKIVDARPAICPMINMVEPPKENGVRTGSTNERLPEIASITSTSTSKSGESNDLCNHEQRSPFSDNSIMCPLGSSHKSGSADTTKQDCDSNLLSDSKPSLVDVEAEMKILRLKLKQTMDIYNSACKEATSAQNKAKELKLDEGGIVDEAELSKEAALALAEQEKAKAKAALEAADEAMKMVEKEAQRRLHAEMKARREAQQKNRALKELAFKDTRYRKYTINDIENATQKFNPSLKIGEGGYGPVFKGQLDHTPVAIKILNPKASHGRKQFQQEVEVLCSIRHPNMVLLLGACPEYGCLVYEYLDNGSLEDRLLRKNNSPPIPWWKRFEIAAEIATALLFLHQTKPEPIVHRDLKPANILLDKNYVSKISDVGLARLVPPCVADSVTQYHLTAAAGTFCYIDPQYQQTGKLTTKSDIYSLGIMLLQIITAKPPSGLAHLVRRAIENETFSDMLDPVVTDWPMEEALAFAKLSLSCAELSKKDRPDLASVIVPEFNRLRDFGFASENNHKHSHPLRPPTPTGSPR